MHRKAVERVDGMDEIRLDGMEFYGYHGCLMEERERGQLFFVDLVLFLDLREAGERDALAATLNYAEVYGRVRAIVEGKPCALIEAVAECVASDLLGAYSTLRRVAVTVHKPAAPIGGRFRDVSVHIVRARA